MKTKSNNPDCSFIRSNLFSYQEKQLSGREYREFEDHLHSCEECSRIVSDFQSVSSFIDLKKSYEPSPFIRTRILQRIENQMEGPSEEANPFLKRILRPISVSFILLIAIIIGVSIGKQRDTRLSNSIDHINDIQSMKAELHIPDFIDEDYTFFDNH